MVTNLYLPDAARGLGLRKSARRTSGWCTGRAVPALACAQLKGYQAHTENQSQKHCLACFRCAGLAATDVGQACQQERCAWKPAEPAVSCVMLP